MKKILTILAFLPMLAPLSARALGDPGEPPNRPKYFRYCEPQLIAVEDREIVAQVSDRDNTQRLWSPPSSTEGVPGSPPGCPGDEEETSYEAADPIHYEEVPDLVAL